MSHKKLKKFFDSKGLSQKDVGDILGYSATMMSKYYRGIDDLNAKFIRRLVTNFPDVDLQDLFTEDDANTLIAEPLPFYGLNDDNIDKELKNIIKKVENVREYLAQNRHK